MVVYRLFNCLSLLKPCHIRFKLRKIVRIRVKRGNIEAIALFPVKFVVIIKGNSRYHIGPEYLADGVSECRLSRTAIPDHTNNKNPWGPCDNFLEVGDLMHVLRVLAMPCVISHADEIPFIENHKYVRNIQQKEICVRNK